MLYVRYPNLTKCCHFVAHKLQYRREIAIKINIYGFWKNFYFCIMCASAYAPNICDDMSHQWPIMSKLFKAQDARFLCNMGTVLTHGSCHGICRALGQNVTRWCAKLDLGDGIFCECGARNFVILTLSNSALYPVGGVRFFSAHARTIVGKCGECLERKSLRTCITKIYFK